MILSKKLNLEGIGFVGRLFLYAKLSFVMGLSWVFGFLAALFDWPALWYVFIIFNSLQGAFICLSFVCTAKVFRLMRGGGGSKGGTTTGAGGRNTTQTAPNRVNNSTKSPANHHVAVTNSTMVNNTSSGGSAGGSVVRETSM